jgi:hypothetical protein
MIIRIITEIKEDKNKCQNEVQENKGKQFKEIRKTIQDYERGFNKDIEILKHKIEILDI